MKPSRYNVTIDDLDDLIIFNTLTGALARCAPESARKAKALLAAPNDETIDERLRSALTDERFLVSDDMDELTIVKDRKRAGATDRNRLDLIVMPTLACNFRCTYCFEGHPKSAMSTAVQQSVARWMEREIPKHKLTILHWYGGEPLMGFDTIVALTQHATSLARRAGMELTAHATTNGYLLTEARIRALSGAGVFGYQITLDGAPVAHNRLRVLRNGRPTFDRVYQNIIKLVRADPHVSTTLRINFNSTNIETIPELLRMFPDDVRPRLHVVFEPIFGDEKVSAAGTVSAHSISAAMAEDYALAQELGYSVRQGLGQVSPRLVYCYAEREHQLIINHNGDVFKCSVSNFEPGERVGYIDVDGNLIRDEVRWGHYAGDSEFAPECEECAFLPVCMGGCRCARLKDGTTGSQCSLIPTNTTVLLKSIALGTLSEFFCAACRGHTR